MPDQAVPTEVTSVEEWRADRKGKLVTLPSNKTVRLRTNIDIMLLMKQGRIPNHLMRSYVRLTSGMAPTNADEVSDEDLAQLNEVIEILVMATVLEPKVLAPPKDHPDPLAWEPDDPSAISLYDIDSQDRMFIYQFAQGAVTDLESFRKLQDAQLAAMANGRQVSSPAKRPAGNKRSARGVVR